MKLKQIFVWYVELVNCSDYNSEELEHIENVLQSADIQYRYKFTEIMESRQNNIPGVIFDRIHNKITLYQTARTEEKVYAIRTYFKRTYKYRYKKPKVKITNGEKFIHYLPDNAILVQKKKIKQADELLAELV